MVPFITSYLRWHYSREDKSVYLLLYRIVLQYINYGYADNRVFLRKDTVQDYRLHRLEMCSGHQLFISKGESVENSSPGVFGIDSIFAFMPIKI